MIRLPTGEEIQTSPVRLTLLTLGDPGALTGGYLYHRHLAETAPHHGAHLTFASVTPGAMALLPIRVRAALTAALRARPHAVLVDSILAWAVWPSLRNLGVAIGPPRLIAVVHQPPGGIDSHPLLRSLQAPLDRRVYRRVDLAIAASRTLGEGLARTGVAAERIAVIPPGADLAPTGDPLPDPRRGRRVALLCIANWQPQKGIHLLLEAMARLPTGSATLHLVGDTRPHTRYGRRVARRVRRPDLSGRVVVHGALPPTGVAACYRAADAFVLPSLVEPYGTVYGEALRAGLPVVGFRAGNLPHLIADGREGLLFSPGDVDALAGGLRRIAEEEDLRAALREAARETGARLPTWAETARRFFAAVRSLIDRP